jgi:uncharacterized membrane protein
MSPDGATVVGKSASDKGVEAFRWTASSGMQALGDLPGGEVFSIAFDVSSQGLVVGTATSDAGLEAFLWDSKHGMRRLKDVLTAAGVASASSRPWRRRRNSADGRTIAGNGTNPDGKPEGWIARIP